MTIAPRGARDEIQLLRRASTVQRIDSEASVTDIDTAREREARG
jgi:hypothetical protein